VAVTGMPPEFRLDGHGEISRKKEKTLGRCPPPERPLAGGTAPAHPIKLVEGLHRDAFDL